MIPIANGAQCVQAADPCNTVALLASGQISMRKVDGWLTLGQPPINSMIDLAACRDTVITPETATAISNTSRYGTAGSTVADRCNSRRRLGEEAPGARMASC